MHNSVLFKNKNSAEDSIDLTSNYNGIDFLMSEKRIYQSTQALLHFIENLLQK